MCNYNKTQVSPYDPRKRAIHSNLRPEDDLISNCGQNFKQTVSSDNLLRFVCENIVTYLGFDCGILSTMELLQKFDRSTDNGITYPDPLKNPSAFSATINITLLLMSSTALLSF